MRIPIHFMIIISMYIVVKTFNAYIPFTKILGNMPLTFFIGAIPITPGGIGTTNAAFVELLSPYLSGEVLTKIGAKELLFTTSLLWLFANYSLKATLGTILLKKASSDMFKETDVPEDEVEDNAARLGGNI